MVRNDYLEILNGFYFKQLGTIGQLNTAPTQKFVLNTIYCGVGKLVEHEISGLIVKINMSDNIVWYEVRGVEIDFPVQK